MRKRSVTDQVVTSTTTNALIPRADEGESTVRHTTATWLATAASFGEGPLWDDARGLLWWTDIPGSAVHSLDPRTGEDRALPVARTVGTIAHRASGGLVVASQEGFAAMGPDGELETLATVNTDPAMRMNDGKPDPAGRFYASSMAFNAAEGAGSLIRLDADLSTHTQVGDLTIGNGLDWSPDGETLYFTDTMSFGVDAFSCAPTTGDLSNRRRLFDIPADEGWPDGMCVDAEGALWVALWGGSAVRRYSPDGELLEVIDLPVEHVTCAAFGGSDYRDLYITTAAPTHAGSDAINPQGGAVFVARPDVGGRPPNAFAG